MTTDIRKWHAMLTGLLLVTGAVAVIAILRLRSQIGNLPTKVGIKKTTAVAVAIAGLALTACGSQGQASSSPSSQAAASLPTLTCADLSATWPRS